MTQTNLTHEQEMHVESHSPYIKVFLWLAVFTAIEYFYARWQKDAFSSLVMGLMLCAVIKASMVGWYFMHLKFEGRWVYYMLVPAGILATVLIVGLTPDIALQPVTEDPTDEDEPTAYSARLGTFHSLDLRVEKTWTFTHWKLSAYADVRNVYNRRNPEALSYNYNYTQTQVVGGFPILPILGVRGEL